MRSRPTIITKELSRNDTGETGGHQAGILVPKDPALLAFFPELEEREYNPRYHLPFTDHFGTRWEFAFIYYNNARFGGTRNEYRLTRMTPFFHAHNLRAGDVLEMRREDGSRYIIGYKRQHEVCAAGDRLVLGAGWRVVKI